MMDLMELGASASALDILSRANYLDLDELDTSLSVRLCSGQDSA